MQIYSRVLLKLLPMLDSLPGHLKDKALSYHTEVLSLIDYETEAACHAVDTASKQLATAVFLRQHAWLCMATITDNARLMVSTTAILPHARLKMRALQAWFLAHFNPQIHPQSMRLPLTLEVRDSLRWWSNLENLQRGHPFHTDGPSIQLTTDARDTGWGAHCNGLRTHGLWTNKQKTHQINYLELLTVFNTLRSFEFTLTSRMVQVVTDNTTALYYINKQGGTHSRTLLAITLELWEWGYRRNIFPVAVYIATHDNVLADHLNHLRHNSHEWSLHHQTFLDLCSLWGQPQMDLFATELNSKCPAFCSRAGLGQRSLGDAL
ncbi:hypothetical protein JRQ81_001367 [Phrynocephalus forsythii]|uniref:Reverse transcriptase RNase H-like domain-containing protein n=1 Tax=Phrynocephalus forsythii TaxID=171643 RepID=A0A9Q0Y859_9SAUR|nr:hypothetical protein JRQ81_001367 [Phrynocephalus forsythii]